MAIPVLVAGVIGLVINLGSAWYLHAAGEDSVNLRGAMLHMLADAAGSVAAIVSALVIWQFGWVLIDPILSVVIAGLILVGSWPLLRDTVNIVLQRAPNNIDVEAVRSALLADETVHAVPDLHVWQLVDGVYVATAIVCSDVDQPLSEVETRRRALKEKIARDFDIDHATIEWHFEPEPHAHDAKNCAI